jgi:integrase
VPSLTVLLEVPINDASTTHEYQEILGGTSLPPIRVHDLRHTCATVLLAMKLPPRVIMETLGHSQITLTMNTYAHVTRELQGEVVEKMNAPFGGE